MGDRECNSDGCSGDQVADWGVCVDCFREDMRRMNRDIFGEGDDDA